MDVLQNGSLRFTQHHALNDPFEGSFSAKKQLTCEDVEKLTMSWQIVNDSVLRIVEEIGFEEFLDHFSKALALAEPIEADHLFQPFEKVLRESLDDFSSLERYEFLQSFLVQAYRWILADRMVDLFHYGLRKMPEVLVLSLSESNDDNLMWSHYSDSHRGFALGFASDAEFLTNGGVADIRGIQKVSYSNTVPEALNLNPSDFFRILLIKSAEWAYEKEWRVLSMPEFSERTIPADPFDIHLFGFDEVDLKEVVFGARCDDKTRHEISDLVQRKYSSEVKFCEATIDRGNFSVRVQSITL